MTASVFSIKIDESDLKNVRDMLSDMKDIGIKVTVRALNKTLTGVRTDASSAIRAEITASKQAVDGTFKIEKATSTRVQAAIASTGKPLPLTEYSTRQTKRGVSVQVKRSRPRKVIPGAFVAAMKSKHEGAFWREWHGQKQAKRADLRYGKLPRKFRLPIKQLYGPRVPDIMSNDPVMKLILGKAGDRLHNNLAHETEFELSKHK
jgi:hypothetical protein